MKKIILAFFLIISAVLLISCDGGVAPKTEGYTFRDALGNDVTISEGEKIAAAGYKVGNIDVTMIAQRPKLKPHIPQMMENIAADLGIELGRVNVKATTEEKLGFTGEGLGMACHAVCLLENK